MQGDNVKYMSAARLVLMSYCKLLRFEDNANDFEMKKIS